jgi:hypothetical protein
MRLIEFGIGAIASYMDPSARRELILRRCDRPSISCNQLSPDPTAFR